MGANDLSSIGQPVRRKEDYRFLTGAGQYTDDVNPRAPDVRVLPALAARAREDPQHRHGKAKPAPGVVAIFTGADLDGRQRPAVRLADHQHRRHSR